MELNGLHQAFSTLRQGFMIVLQSLAFLELVMKLLWNAIVILGGQEMIVQLLQRKMVFFLFLFYNYISNPIYNFFFFFFLFYSYGIFVFVFPYSFFDTKNFFKKVLLFLSLLECVQQAVPCWRWLLQLLSLLYIIVVLTLVLDCKLQAITIS